MTEIKRKLYKRGTSLETTIPRPLLFAIDENMRHDVVFSFNSKKKRWYVEFEEKHDKKDDKKQEIAG